MLISQEIGSVGKKRRRNVHNANRLGSGVPVAGIWITNLNSTHYHSPMPEYLALFFSFFLSLDLGPEEVVGNPAKQ